MRIPKEKLLELLKTGWSVPEIASEFDVSVSTVRNYIKRLEQEGYEVALARGMKRKRVMTPYQRKALEIYRKHGTIKAVADAFGIRWQSAKKLVERAKRNAEEVWRAEGV